MIYRVREPLQVMFGEPSEPSFVEIMAGSIITVKGNVQKSGRVEVRYNGQIFVAIVCDILERFGRG